MAKEMNIPIVVGFLHDPNHPKFFERAMNYVDKFGKPGMAYGVELPSFEPTSPEWVHEFGKSQFGRLAIHASEKGMKVIPLRSSIMHEAMVNALNQPVRKHYRLGKQDSKQMVNAILYHQAHGEKFGLITTGTEHARHIKNRIPSVYVSATARMDAFTQALPRLYHESYTWWMNNFEKMKQRRTQRKTKRQIKKGLKQPLRRKMA